MASAVAAIFWISILENRVFLVALCLAWFLVGVLAVEYFERTSRSHDSSKIVVDEWVGMGISLLLIPWTWGWVVAAFAIFRFFDIFKPLGVGAIDRNWSGPWGVIMDDVLAGVYTCIVLAGIRYLFFL